MLNRCNQDCAYCDSRAEPCVELPTGRIIEIIGQMKEAGVVRVSYTGGEPLLRVDIGRILYETRKTGISSVLTTNGLLLPQKIAELKFADKIVMSYDGPEELHDELRGKGTHRKVLEAIDSARANLDARIELRCVLTSHNIDGVEEALAFSNSQRIPIGFSIAQEFPFSSGAISELLPGEEKAREAIDLIIRAKKVGGAYIIPSLAALKHLRKWPADAHIPCASGNIFCRIDSQGDIMSCGKYLNTRGKLNCRDNNFADAFAALKPTGCGQCWCDNKIDLNLIYSFNSQAILSKMSEL